MKHRSLSRLPVERSPTLSFAPLAWLKLQWFCHQGDTEVGGFGITSERDPLHVIDFVTVRQSVTPVTVRFEDLAVADFFDACIDRGLIPERFARIWLHTHPGSSPKPSDTDEQTFARVFGSCDWSVMFILARTGRTYVRLAFSAGPGGDVFIPAAIDWASLPKELTASLDARVAEWRQEFTDKIRPALPPISLSAFEAGRSPFADSPSWDAEPWSLCGQLPPPPTPLSRSNQ